MARLCKTIAALFVLFAAAITPVRLSADPADITAASRSVVRVALVWIDGKDAGIAGHGSGFVVAPDLVVTNAHVVAPMADDDTIHPLIIPSQGKRGWAAKVVAYSPKNDLALLRIEGGTLPVATLSPAAVTDGQPVYAVGYPGSVDLAQGLDAVDMITPIAPVKTQGTASAGRSSKSFATVLHTASIAAGNSGGPLMDACGRVIGANSFGTVSDGSDAEFFFAVAMPEIMRFLRENNVTPKVNAMPCQSMDDF
ncbi:S1C family serine protease, partial [Novosphingobium sp.]|uniref:S1C family serine protease n=1 Tax=Novosphingobium sp. TaxID=1874826 RepID=UPI0035B2B08B